MHALWMKKSHDVARGPQWTRRCPFELEQEHPLVTHAPRSPQDRLDGRIDRFDDAKAHAMITVGGDPLDVAEQKVAEPLHFGQPLPAERL